MDMPQSITSVGTHACHKTRQSNNTHQKQSAREVKKRARKQQQDSQKTLGNINKPPSPTHEPSALQSLTSEITLPARGFGLTLRKLLARVETVDAAHRHCFHGAGV
jgi:hypothetical protein